MKSLMYIGINGGNSDQGDYSWARHCKIQIKRDLKKNVDVISEKMTDMSMIYQFKDRIDVIVKVNEPITGLYRWDSGYE